MKSSRLFDRRAGFSLGAIGILLGMILPAVLPTFASAAQLSTRSIQMSTSAVSAQNVNYEVKFHTTSAAAAAVIDFCNDSPVPGQACTSPAGFTVAGVTTSTSSATVSDMALNSAHSTVKVVYGMSANSDITIDLGGITNPNYVTDTTANHGFYARIVTYDTSGHAANYAYTSGTPAEGAGAKDDGGIALAVTQTIGVSAAVRESMTFCVSGVEPTGDCGADGAGSAVLPTDPSLKLGTGTPAALDSSLVSTGNDYAQISTNAVNGAVVNMKNDKTCGGLQRFGASGCDIAPAPTSGSDFVAGNALFGVKLGSIASAPSAPTPSGSLAISTGYDHYFMDYNSGSPTTAGVTGTYGSPLFTTSGAPVNNKDVKLTFAASMSNTTPAGLYTANLSLIATGTF